MDTEYLDNVLIKVTKLLDIGLSWEQTKARVKDILEKPKCVFELIQQDTTKYPLLAGFCYKLGIQTVKEEKKAFQHWEKDVTPYGHYLVGTSYFYGIGVDIDYDKAFLKYKLSADV